MVTDNVVASFKGLSTHRQYLLMGTLLVFSFVVFGELFLNTQPIISDSTDALFGAADADVSLHVLKQLASESYASSTSMIVAPSPSAVVPLSYAPNIAKWNNVTISQNDTSLWTCLGTCCISSKVVNDYFTGEPERKPEFRDMLSNMDYKLIADLHYGNMPQPDNLKSGIVKLNDKTLPCLQDGVVIFVDMWSKDDFFKDMLPKIKVKFVLITGDSDEPNPPYNHWDRIKNDSRLIHWFALNYQGLRINETSTLISPIPLGNSQWNNQKENMVKAYQEGFGLINGTIQSQLKNESAPMILSSFRVKTNERLRKPIWDLACEPTGRLFNLTTCLYGIDQLEFYKRLSLSRFTLSPHGRGIDCYRTYEALLLGTFPIVKTSSLDPIYENLPVLILREWEDLNLELLKKTYERFRSNRTFEFKKLYKGYWFDSLRSFGYKPHTYLGVEGNPQKAQ